MLIEKAKFKTLTPSQFITYTVRNSLKTPCHLHTSSIHIAVLDSPVAVSAGVLPFIAAIIVPKHRETEWQFCTESGHRQLLFELSPSISRLILISNNFPPNSQDSNYIRPSEFDTADRKKLEDELQGKLYYLNPTVCIQKGFLKFQFLPFEDRLLYRVIVDRYEGPVVGQFIVEDVLMKNEDTDHPDDKLMRNMRFKRMPKLIQSQVDLWPYKADGQAVLESLNLENLKEMEKNVMFRLDTTILIHSHLITMVCGLLLHAPLLCEQNEQGAARRRALCLGVGGGALLSFLNTTFRFEVVGVEADKDVLIAAKKHFGFQESDSIRVIVGDAVKEIQNFQSQKTRFDVVMVDLDSSDSRNGICAPPKEFVNKSVFQAVKLLLHEHGVVIINVVYAVKGLVYMELVQQLKDAFHKVYQINGKEDNNVVLMAFVSPPRSSDKLKNDMVEKWGSLIPEINYHRESYIEWSSS